MKKGNGDMGISYNDQKLGESISKLRDVIEDAEKFGGRTPKEIEKLNKILVELCMMYEGKR